MERCRAYYAYYSELKLPIEDLDQNQTGHRIFYNPHAIGIRVCTCGKRVSNHTDLVKHYEQRTD